MDGESLFMHVYKISIIVFFHLDLISAGAAWQEGQSHQSAGGLLDVYTRPAEIEFPLTSLST